MRGVRVAALLLVVAGSATDGVADDPPKADKPVGQPPTQAAQPPKPETTPANGNGHLPKFTEEREAAAISFARKHFPELLPLLDKLKAADQKKYREEISEIFQTAELLGELHDEDRKRHDLELEIWKTQTRSLILVARLGNAADEDKPRLTDELHEAAKKLVDLDMQILRLRVDELERELNEAREELARGEEKREAAGKERYQKLLDQAKRRKMMP